MDRAESCFPEDLNKHMRKRRIDFDEFEIRTSSGRVYFNTRRARNEIREHFKDGIKCHYFSREEIERYNEIYKFGLLMLIWTDTQLIRKEKNNVKNEMESHDQF